MNMNIENRFDTVAVRKVKKMSLLAATLSILILTSIGFVMSELSIYNLVASINEYFSPRYVDPAMLDGVRNNAALIDFTFALLCSFMFAGLLYFFVFANTRLWLKINKNMDISGTWYVYQTTPNDSEYFRIGSARIEQEYDQYIMTTETKNIQYKKSPESFGDHKRNAQLTTTTEHGTIMNAVDIQGVYSASRVTGNPGGLGVAVIQRNEKNKPTMMTGEFRDAVFSDGTPRSGVKIFFRDDVQYKEEYRAEVMQLCRERCGTSDEYTSILKQPERTDELGNVEA